MIPVRLKYFEEGPSWTERRPSSAAEATGTSIGGTAPASLAKAFSVSTIDLSGGISSVGEMESFNNALAASSPSFVFVHNATLVARQQMMQSSYVRKMYGITELVRYEPREGAEKGSLALVRVGVVCESADSAVKLLDSSLGGGGCVRFFMMLQVRSFAGASMTVSAVYIDPAAMLWQRVAVLTHLFPQLVNADLVLLVSNLFLSQTGALSLETSAELHAVCTTKGFSDAAEESVEKNNGGHGGVGQQEWSVWLKSSKFAATHLTHEALLPAAAGAKASAGITTVTLSCRGAAAITIPQPRSAKSANSRGSPASTATPAIMTDPAILSAEAAGKGVTTAAKGGGSVIIERLLQQQQQQQQQQHQQQRYHFHHHHHHHHQQHQQHHQQHHQQQQQRNSDQLQTPIGKRAKSYQDVSNLYGVGARRSTSHLDLPGYGAYAMPPPPPPPPTLQYAGVEEQLSVDERKLIVLARPPETLTEEVRRNIFRIARDAVEDGLPNRDWITNDLSRVLGPNESSSQSLMTSVYVILLRALMDPKESERTLFCTALERGNWERSILGRGFAWCLTKIIAERDVADCPRIYSRFVDVVTRVTELNFLCVTKDIIARTARYLDVLQVVYDETEEWEEDFIHVWDKLLVARQAPNKVTAAESMESMSFTRLGSFLRGILPDFVASMVQAGFFTEDELRQWRQENESNPKFRAITEELAQLYP